MRKYILVILLLLSCAVHSSAQGIITGSTQPRRVTWDLGGRIIDSILVLPVRDTVAWTDATFRSLGRITIRPQDSGIYYHRGNKWVVVGGSGSTTDTSSLSNRINSKLNISDTSAMLANYRTNLNAKVKYTDTATMLLPYLRKLDTANLSARINLKQNNSDTTVWDATRSWVGQNYVPQARTITINGTTQDLSTDRIWSIPTSIDSTTVGFGLDETNNALNVDTTEVQAKISGTLLTNWQTAYNDKVNSLAVTGTSTKTITLTQQDGGTVSGTFPDADTAYTSGTGISIVNHVIANTGVTTETDPLSLHIADTNTAFSPYATAINARVKYTDTAAMLSNYASNINLRVKYTDTAAMLANYATNINNRVKYTDTSGMLANYLTNINLRLKIADTGAMLANYLSNINARVKYTDTSSMLANYITNINARLKISDTSTMLSPYLRKLDTATLSNRINLKFNTADTAGLWQPFAYVPTLQQVTTAGNIITNSITTNSTLQGTRFNVDNGSFLGSIRSALLTGTRIIQLPDATDTLVGTIGTQNIFNKTFIVPKINVGSDASFDIYYRDGSGIFSRLPNSTTGTYLGANTGAAPAWKALNFIGTIGGSTDNAITRWDGTGGTAIQNSNILVNDNGGLQLPQVQNTITYAIGQVAFDTTCDCIIVDGKTSATRMNVGQELWENIYNNTGSTITSGQAVYINGGILIASEVFATVALAQATVGTSVCIGIATEDILTGARGKITGFGTVHNLNTSGLSIGNVFLSASVAGGLTNTAPSAPNIRHRVGVVVRVDATTGAIKLTPSTGSLGNGTANQKLGMDAAGSSQEWKTESGTANRITVTQGVGTTAYDISAAYVGQSSINTAGTITTGTWNATAITVPFGGTGRTTNTAYSLMAAGTTSAGNEQNVGTGISGQTLLSGGSAALPVWSNQPIVMKSGVVNGLVAATTTLFTTDALKGDFVITQVIATITALTGSPTTTLAATAGHTGNAAATFTIPSTNANAVGKKSLSVLNAGVLNVPASTAVSITITTAHTVATVVSYRVDVLGYYTN